MCVRRMPVQACAGCKTGEETGAGVSITVHWKDLSYSIKFRNLVLLDIAFDV